MSEKTEKKQQLDGLFGHLCSSSGLYSKETFLSLVGCITRMIRDHHMTGFVLARTLEDEAFEALTLTLEGAPNLPLFRFNQADLFPDHSGICDQTGFLIVLTDRLCAALYWNAATNETFRMFEGGWTFNPGDSRTIAQQVIGQANETNPNAALDHLLAETPIDRRYDEKLNLLITSLVHGLETRNRELTVALDQVKSLNKRVVDHERLAAIGQLSSVIAHEIRNPLGLIDLYAKLTEDGMAALPWDAVPAAEGTKKTPAQQSELLMKNLGLIRVATVNLEKILSGLTNYSRPLTLERTRTNLHQLVADVCDFYLPSYEQKGVRLILPPTDGPALMLDLDVDQIRQALVNLLKNALEATPQASVVTVSVSGRSGDPQVYVRVADEGPGVSESNAKKLFTPYFSTKGSNGTGLGLAHSRKILQAHGGSVELLASPSGKGATFALILPTKTVEA